jgi:hypothetical protein
LCYGEEVINRNLLGGVCTFDNCENPTCPGGACKFTNVPTTLTEGYCAGGACKLEDESFPSSLESTLSQ